MICRLRIDMQFHLLSGVHITGEQGKLWVDKALVVDWHNGEYPIVPATTLKGWLRESAERLLRGLGIHACDVSNAMTICGTCAVCDLFGSPKKRSPLSFQDAVLSDALTDVRMNASLSRYRKTTYEERLFSTEIAWHNALNAKVLGFFTSEIDVKKAAALLWLAAKAGFAIGAVRSRGLGWLELAKFQVQLNNTMLSYDEMTDMIAKSALQKGVNK